MECSYSSIKLDKNTHAVKHLPNIRIFCSKMIPFIYYYKKQVESYNQTVYNILTKEISLILQHLKRIRKKREACIITMLVTGFIILAYEEISSYFYIMKGKKLYKRAFDAMERKENLERNKIFHLEDSVVMYSVYNAKNNRKFS